MILGGRPVAAQLIIESYAYNKCQGSMLCTVQWQTSPGGIKVAAVVL